MIRLAPFAALVALLVSLSLTAHAWGRRGHSIVCETAALVLQTDSQNGVAFMKRHSYDLGYYCNVPDLAWRAPETSDIEGPQHYMDMELFTAAFAAAGSGANKKAPGASGSDPFSLSRAEFEAAYPSVGVKAGRSFWRIREIEDLLGETTKSLKATATAPNEQLDQVKATQLEWLVRAGTMAHYVGDLSMPLHLTEDYDGVKENQKGVHSFFEDASVDELYANTQLLNDVRERALKRWKSYSKDRDVLKVLEDLAKQSGARKDELLKIDRKNGRADLKKAAAAFEPMIRDQLVEGALAVAAIWKRNADVIFNEDHFYVFSTTPGYIYPPGTSSVDAGAYAKKPSTPAPSAK